ncbi:MAG: SRPBCC domain-containing protein [Balneolaceae bacterium]|nr:SRPBCC domain-containing protein [Balneolaceae bacterium]
MEKIEVINYIKAPVSGIYKVLTTEKGLGAIWTPKLAVKPEIGFVNEFDFNEESLTKMKILELDADSRILWECVESDPEWVGTRVSFELEEKNGVTTVLLKHSRWRELTEYYRWCNYNWSMLLMRLKEYCE